MSAPTLTRARPVVPATGLLGRAWARLGDPPGPLAARGREVPGTLIIAGAAALIGIIATIVVWRAGGLLLYNDAQTHMVISRRVLDSQNPGFQQLGTVWLPVPHILLLPFIVSFPLWQSGLAASVLGVACLAVSAAAIWRVSFRLGVRRSARLIAVAVLVLNPTMLYLSTTALTEPVLIATMLAALAGLSGWIIAMPAVSPGELAVFAGIPSAAAVLSRYEGWAFVAVGTAFVLIASWRRWRSASYSVSLVLSYLAAPAVAMAWWLSYNWVRYGDPLDFARGEYSAAKQQGDLASVGLLPTKGNLGLSFTTYNWTVVNVLGIAIVVLALLGLVALLWTRGLSTLSLLVLGMGFVYPFALVAMWLGQTAMRNDASLPLGMFNIRFGAPLIPVAALLIGVLVDWAWQRRRPVGAIATGLVTVLVVASSAWALAAPSERMGVIREGNINAQGRELGVQAARYIGENYEGGFILMDDVANPYMMDLNVPLNQLWASYNGEDWDRVLANPYDNAAFVLTNSENGADRVYAAVSEDPNFRSRFFPVFSAGPFTVWQNSASIGVTP